MNGLMRLALGLIVACGLFTAIPAHQAHAQVAVAAQRGVITYVPERRGLFGRRTVYRPAVAVPVAATAYYPPTVVTAAPVITQRAYVPRVAAPVVTQRVYAPQFAAPVVTQRVYAPQVAAPIVTQRAYVPAAAVPATAAPVVTRRVVMQQPVVVQRPVVAQPAVAMPTTTATTPITHYYAPPGTPTPRPAAPYFPSFPGY